MVTVKAYYDGHGFIPESPVAVEINQEAIITLSDGKNPGAAKKERLLSLAGSISHEEYLEIEKALEDTEKVHLNEW
jgi:hypothetical protein